jgi:hypothetical protein
MQQGRSVTLVNIQSALHGLPGQFSVGGNTLSEQMAASGARAADQAILAIPMEQIVREAIAIAMHAKDSGAG